MVTIHHLEINFDVESEDAELFKQHFDRAIARWWRAQQEQAKTERRGRENAALIPPRRE
jgi:hypothetical protein